MSVRRALSFHRVLAFAVASLATASPTLAQVNDPAAADALFQKGREAAEKGEWTTACPKFAESQRLDPALGTLLNLADCEEHLGRLASAYEHFKTALDTMPATDDRLGFTKQRIAGLERTVPHLTLTAPPDFPADARVIRDDVQLGAASFGLAMPVNPGSHTVVVMAPGHAETRVSVTLKAGEAESVPLRIGAVVAASLGSSPSSSSSRDAPSTSSSGVELRTAGFVLGAVGLAGAGVGAVTGIMVLGKKSIVNDPSHCDPTTHVCDQTGLDAASSGKTLSTVSTVAFVAGGALLVTGVVLVLAGGASAHPSPSATLVGPETYAGGGAGLRVIGSF